MRGSGPEISDGEFKPGGTPASEHWLPSQFQGCGTPRDSGIRWARSMACFLSVAF